MSAKLPIAFLAAFFAAALAAVAPAVAQTDPPPQANRPVPQGAAKEPAPPPSVSVIGARDAHGMLGREVRSAADENMGRIVDVIVDRTGQVRAAVIDFGGFLASAAATSSSTGTPCISSAFRARRDAIGLELTKEQVTAAPEYKEDAPVIVRGSAGSLRPLEFDR